MTPITATAKARIRFWILLSFLFLASMIFHAIIWREAPLITPDSHGYLQAAQDLKDLRLEALPDRSLGYPLLLVLAASADNPRQGLFILQMLLHFMSALLLVFVMRTVGLHKSLIVAFVVLASLPPSVAPAGYVLSETASEFTLTLAVSGLLLWLAGRGGGWLILSLLFTVASALVRPTYQLLGPILACTLVVIAPLLPEPPRRLRVAALWLILAPSFLLGGVILFNQRNYGFPGLTPLFGFNLTTRTIHFVERLPDEQAAIRDVLVAHRNNDLVVSGSDHTGYMSVWMAIPELQVVTGLSKPALSQKMLRLNLLLIRRAPLNYLAEVVRSMATYWMPTPPDLANCGSRVLQLTWGLLILMILMLFTINVFIFSGLILLAYSIPQHRGRWFTSHDNGIVAGIVVALCVIYYSMTVSALVETGNPRYRGPTELLIWFSLLLGVELWKRLRTRP